MLKIKFIQASCVEGNKVDLRQSNINQKIKDQDKTCYKFWKKVL